MPTEAYLNEMITRIVRQVQPLQIILFGSYARGVAGPDSDIDLLVVLPYTVNKRHSAVAIRRLLTDMPISKDIFVTTPEEIKESKTQIGSFLGPALREGKVLYEQPHA